MKNERLFKIISIMLLIILFFPYASVVLAAPVTDPATAEQVSNAIATFAINYYNKVQTNEVPYISHPYNYGYNTVAQMKDHRRLNLNPPNPPLRDGTHYMIDCVGWVSYCIYSVTGFEYQGALDGSSGYVVPSSGIRDTTHFERVNRSEIRPGDILFNAGHVSVYVGGNDAIGSNGAQHYGGNVKGPYYEHGIVGNCMGGARVKVSEASKISASTLITDPSLPMALGGSAVMNESDFYYNGIPDGKYSVTAGFLEWIIPSLKEIFDYIIGILTLCQRMAIVGWAAIIENIISSSVANIDEVEDNDSTERQDPTSIDVQDEKITIESIIFDGLDFLDIRFYNIEDTTPATP